MGARDSVLVGSAGEHYVLYHLLRQGLLASLSPPNAYAADILVFSPGMSVGSMVQVKTRTSGRDQGWHMRSKHEGLVHPPLFYALVDLEPPMPEVFIVPSAVVADVLRRSHGTWLATPGQKGQPHRQTDLRRLLSAYSFEVPNLDTDWLAAYRDRWDHLTTDPGAEAPQDAIRI